MSISGHEDPTLADTRFEDSGTAHDPATASTPVQASGGSRGTSLHLARLGGSQGEAHLAPAIAGFQQSMTSEWTEARFELGKVIGVGGQGSVYAVEDADFGRTMALKALHAHKADPDRLARFIHEAQVTAQLEHPGVVPVHDLGALDDGTVFYTMKCISGLSLEDHLKKAKSTQFELLQIFLKVCDAVAFAHDRDVIHRDLKPKNIMVGDYGEVLVVDWGLAKVLGKSSVESFRSIANPDSDMYATEDGFAVGTPAYMSPEQARGVHEVDNRSDIFALGVILYEMLAGASPYAGHEHSKRIIHRASRGDWLPIDRVSGCRVPRALAAIVNKAMALEPDGRYESAWSLAADVRHHLAGEAVLAHKETLAESLLRWGRRYRAQLQVAVAVALIAVALGFFAIWYQASLENARVDSLKQEASLQVANDDLESAIASYERLLELRPDDADASKKLVQSRNQLAERLRRDAQETAKQQKLAEAAVLSQRARNLKRAGGLGLEEALELFTQALVLVPSDAEYDEIRAKVLAERDGVRAGMDDRERQAQYQRAAELVAEAESHVAAGEWLEAQVALERAEELTPTTEAIRDLTVLINEGVVAQRQAERQAVAEGLRDEALALADQGDYAAAVSRMQGAIALSPLEGGTELLAGLLRQADRAEQAAAIARDRLKADDLQKGVGKAIAKADLAHARATLAQLTALVDEVPVLGREIPLEALRQQIDEAVRQGRVALADGIVAGALPLLAELKALDDRKAESRRSIHAMELRLGFSVADQDLRARLYAEQESLDQAVARRIAVVGQILLAIERSTTLVDNHRPVERLAANFWAQQVRTLDAEGDTGGAAAAAANGRFFDRDGIHRQLFENQALVINQTARPLRLQAISARPDRQDLASGPVLVIPAGGRLTISAGRYEIFDDAGARAAVRIARGGTTRLDLAASPKNLPDGLVFVPGGAVIDPLGFERTLSGFLLSRVEVTATEWLEFLNDESIRNNLNNGAVLQYVPRENYNATKGLWAKDGKRFILALNTRERPPIDPLVPVTGISRQDVDRFIQWKKAKDGLPWRLPTETEWKLAVSGGDSRPYPWGSAGDPALCYSAPSSSGSALVDRPVGSFPSDRSVQGVLDLAGSVAEFVDGEWGGSARVSVYRGGSFRDSEVHRFSATARRAIDIRVPTHAIGFRLALDVSALATESSP